MVIIEELDESLFIQRFENMKRVETSENPNGNFSYKGLRALFEWLDESYDEENPYKLDVICLCCDYSEYKNLEEYLKDFRQPTKQEDETDEEFKTRVEMELSEQTTLIKLDEDLDDGFIIQNY